MACTLPRRACFNQPLEQMPKYAVCFGGMRKEGGGDYLEMSPLFRLFYRNSSCAQSILLSFHTYTRIGVGHFSWEFMLAFCFADRYSVQGNCPEGVRNVCWISLYSPPLTPSEGSASERVLGV